MSLKGGRRTAPPPLYAYVYIDLFYDKNQLNKRLKWFKSNINEMAKGFKPIIPMSNSGIFFLDFIAGLEELRRILDGSAGRLRGLSQSVSQYVSQ